LSSYRSKPTRMTRDWPELQALRGLLSGRGPVSEDESEDFSPKRHPSVEDGALEGAMDRLRRLLAGAGALETDAALDGTLRLYRRQLAEGKAEIKSLHKELRRAARHVDQARKEAADAKRQEGEMAARLAGEAQRLAAQKAETQALKDELAAIKGQLEEERRARGEERAEREARHGGFTEPRSRRGRGREDQGPSLVALEVHRRLDKERAWRHATQDWMRQEVEASVSITTLPSWVLLVDEDFYERAGDINSKLCSAAIIIVVLERRRRWSACWPTQRHPHATSGGAAKGQTSAEARVSATALQLQCRAAAVGHRGPPEPARILLHTTGNCRAF
jgi:hypothetical protein